MKKKSRKRKLKKRLALKLTIGAGCLVLAAGFGLYGWRAYYYKDKFFKGTVINQIECGELTVEQVEELIRERVEDYVLQIKFRNEVTEEIPGNTIDYKYECDGGVERVMKSQSPLMWISGIFKKHSYEVNENISFDQEKLNLEMEKMNSMREEAQQEPQDAYVVFETDKFVIVDEIAGTKIKKQVLTDAVVAAINESREFVSAEEAEAYEMPNLTKESEPIVREAEQLNSLAGLKITYELPGGEQILDGIALKEWLDVDAEGNYTKDEEKFSEKIREYVEAMAESIDTLGKPRPFRTTSGINVEVEGGKYGWKVDQERERAELKKNIDNLETVVRKPQYSSEEKYTENNGFGKTYIEINLTEQHLYYYQNGKVVLDTPFVSGTLTEERFTPPGVYFLDWKAKDRVLRGQKLPDGTYSYESPVSFWMPFNGGIGLHDATWRGSFGGSIYKYSGSHGCINLPYAKAEKIYDMIDKETPIVCVYTKPYTLHEEPKPEPTPSPTPGPTPTVQPSPNPTTETGAE